MAQYTEEELNLLVAEGQIHVDEIKAIKAEYLADIEQFKQDYIAAFSGKSLGMRNYIINGNFDIWQRATSLTESHTSPQVTHDTADRFLLFHNTTADATQGQWKQEWVVEDNLNWVKLTNIQPLNGVGYTYRPAIYFIEGSTGRNLNNKTVTLSFMMKASHNGVYNVAFGKGDNIEFYNTEFEYSGTGKAQKVTLTVPVPNNAYNEGTKRALEIYFFYQGDSSHPYQSDSNLNRWGGTYLITPKALKWQKLVGSWIQIAQVQLEEGATATAFEHRPVGLEFSLCQRYFQKWEHHYGSFNYRENVAVTICYQTTMRTSGTVIVTDRYDDNGVRFGYRADYFTQRGFRFYNHVDNLPHASTKDLHVFGYTDAEM